MSRRHIQTVIALALSASLLTMSSWVVAQKTGQEHGVLKAPTAATDGATAPSNAAGKTTPTIGGTKLQPIQQTPASQRQPAHRWLGLQTACLPLHRRRSDVALPKTRRPQANPASHDLTIVSRTSIGVRSELLIVNVDGQRLLIGVTAGSIQRLATLPDPLDAVTLASPQDEKARRHCGRT